MIQLAHQNVLTYLQSLPAESVDLVIADPPYFRVTSNKWDHSWKTLEEYVTWAEAWLTETHRVLRHGGSFYLFGYMRVMAHLVPHLHKLGFEYREEITINKGMQAVAGRATKDYKLFPNVTETAILLVKNPRPYIRTLLLTAAKNKKLTSKGINSALGVKTNGGGMWSIYTGDNICGQIPTSEMWSKFQTLLGLNVPYGRISQTFNPIPGLTNVWDDISFFNKNRLHPTQKPYKLIERFVTASSNPGDNVVDLFTGSGVVLKVCEALGRNGYGVDLDEEMLAKAAKWLGIELNYSFPM